MKSNLPAGWSIVKIGEILTFSGGGTPSKHVPQFWNGDISWASVKDVKGKYLTKTQDTITKAGLDASATQLAEPGSVLMVTRMAPGRPIITQVHTAINQDLKIVRPKLPIPSLFIYYAFLNYERKFLEIASGTTVQGIRVEDIKELEIPFPPLAEQHRIVAQLEVIMQKLEASQERLEKLPVLLKKFRQAVLASAVSGKLTETWRSEQPQGETAELFLKRVKRERREQWEENQLAKMMGKQLTLNDSWKQKYEEPAAPNTTDAPEIPKEWAYATFEQVSERVTVGFVGSMKNEYVEEGIPFLRSQNVRENRFSPNGLIYISPEFHDVIRKSTLESGDLVVVRSGSVGTACVIPESLPEANCSDLVIVKQPKVLPDFCGYFMNSAAKSQVSSQTVGIALSHFNTKAMAKMPLPVPPYEEQLEIVRQVKHYFDLADQLEARFEQAAALVEQLPQALLAKAFSGQLVPQDPNDEPASALLERLKTQAPAPAKGKRGRTPKAMADAPLFE